MKSNTTTLKSRIQAGETVHGCWINIGSTVSAEIVGRAGFDWVLIDLEHGAGDVAIMYQQLQVLAGTPTTAVVRTDELSRPKVQRIMDAGASGIMFPRIEQPSEADLAVRSMYYPPRGIRGMAKSARSTGFGTNLQEYAAGLDNNIVGIIQIETLPAMDKINEIAATPGVDVLFVGPSDLSLAFGIFGQLDHPRYQQAIKEVGQAAKKHGKAAGVLLQEPGEYQMYHQLGYRFLACGADGSFVAKGAAEMVKQMNSLIGKK